MKRIGIGTADGQMRIALLEQSRLAEWRTRSESGEPRIGAIYLGKVARVVPGIQSAFLDIGTDEHAFLYVDEAAPPKQRGAEERSISHFVREGETLLVQVIKEATESKAPRLTTQISLQGRLLVYLLPEGNGAGAEPVSLSRKIRDPQKRAELQAVMLGLLADGEGVVVRTEAAEADREQLQQEWMFLRERWQQILLAAQGKRTPGPVWQGDDVIESALRDFLSADVAEVVVEDAGLYQETRRLMQALFPESLAKLRWHREREPLFWQWGIREQLMAALHREVPLPGGGNLVIERTEALTVIDVNTGAFQGRGGQQREQAVTLANVEAAREIARQLRLRDIGGIVLIDFINMRESANRERVLQALRTSLADDPVPAAVIGMTPLGLVEVTRKRTGASLAERMTETCSCCAGSGRLLHSAVHFQHLREDLAAVVRTQEAEAALVELSRRLYEKWQSGQAPVEGWPLHLYVLPGEELAGDRYRILYAGRAEEAERLYLTRTKKP